MIELNENKGEVLCPECKGEKKGLFYCLKCNGTGKLDWIERIVGKKQELRTLAGNWTVSMSNDINTTWSCELDDHIREIASEFLAKEIDRKILEQFSSIQNKQTKIGDFE